MRDNRNRNRQHAKVSAVRIRVGSQKFAEQTPEITDGEDNEKVI